MNFILHRANQAVREALGLTAPAGIYFSMAEAPYVSASISSFAEFIIEQVGCLIRPATFPMHVILALVTSALDRKSLTSQQGNL